MPKRTNLNKPAVFLGNLNTRLRARELCQHIIRLFEHVGVTTKKTHISVITKPVAKFAFVTVVDEYTAQHVVKKLNTQNDIPEHLLSHLVEQGLHLKVDTRRDAAVGNKNSSSDYTSHNDIDDDDDIIDDEDPNYRQYVKQHNIPPPHDNEDDFVSMSKKNVNSGVIDNENENYGQYVQHDITPPQDNEEDFLSMAKRSHHKNSPTTPSGSKGQYKQQPFSANNLAGSNPNYKQQTLTHSDPAGSYNNKYTRYQHPHGHVNQTNQQQQANPLIADKFVATGAHSDSVLIQQQGGAKAKAIAGRGNMKCYTLGKHLGNETRIVEFKAGQGDYKKNHIHNHVSKYLPAFLNSEGGTLIIGVTDRGIVQGLSMSHREEDQMRLKIDGVITQIRPQVFPDMYTVAFVPVVDEIGNIISNLMVVEISIEKGPAAELYQNGKGEAYLRWDGSVQGPLPASSIEEHTKRRLGEELQNMKIQQETLIKEQGALHQKLLHINDHHEQTLNEQSQEKERLEKELEATKQEKLTNDQSLKYLKEKVDKLQLQQENEGAKRLEMEREVEELKIENREWMEKSKRKQKSKTCIIM